jgi:hypothetical protein
VLWTSAAVGGGCLSISGPVRSSWVDCPGSQPCSSQGALIVPIATPNRLEEGIGWSGGAAGALPRTGEGVRRVRTLYHYPGAALVDRCGH